MAPLLQLPMELSYTATISARGTSRFYRSYLSILMQVIKPVKINVQAIDQLCINSSRVAQIAAEEDSGIKLPVEYHLISNSANLVFEEDFSSIKWSAFLEEGDFWFPDKTSQQFGEIGRDVDAITCGYYRRSMFGNSKKFASAGKPPISTLLLNNWRSDRAQPIKIVMTDASICVINSFSKNGPLKTILTF